ncbi:MAG: FAD-binding oxidoreductase [Oxalobacteraceae bacterium]|nr:MAG: FAD-binding oxidoreductase [Oxalobacteraceae bacterium]
MEVKVEAEVRSTDNVTGRAQPLQAVVKPRNVDEVLQLVREARERRVPLYPVSTGLNWGYGSASPVRGAATLVDLSEMRTIRNAERINVDHPVALIEPGVTQGQLSDFLAERCPQLSFNVTGSARDTSILGNALDRGVGYLGPRRDDVFGLEVVTGTAELLRTGFRRLGDESPLAQAHPYGLGPMMDGLFFQGNFGIVTSACFRLLPRAERSVAVSLALRDEARLAELIDVLLRLKRQGVMSGVTHIGNRARTQASLMAGISDYLSRSCGVPPGRLADEARAVLDRVAPFEWTSLGGISGTRGMVSAALAEVRRQVGKLARVTVVDDAKLSVGFGLLHPLRRWPWARANAAAIAAIRPLHGLADGRPTDAAISNLLWRFGRADAPARELDASDCGLIFVNPALPMDGRSVVKAAAGMQAVAAGFGHALYMTLNIETTTSLVAVINLLFDRTDAAAVENAHACARALWDYVRSMGLEVYRARADMMQDLVDANDPFWRKAWELKTVFDPDNLIAPGRYNLAQAPQS